MKLLKITAAIAATAAVATAQAATISGGGLNGVATDADSAVAVSAVAIVASTQLVDGLRAMQGFDAACTGNVSMLCAPSISTIISKKSADLCVSCRLLILPKCCAMTVVTVPRTPRSLLTIRFIRPTRLSGISGPRSQATSTHRSGASTKLSSVSQSFVWIATPLPGVRIPTILSPGSGWQQFE